MIKLDNILALDMACGEIAVCVYVGDVQADDDSLEGQKKSFFSSVSASSQHGKMRSTVIVPLMNDVLSQAGIEWHQLDALALGAGPGSFTGLRIAAATLAGINSGLALPILHLSSLSITARQAELVAGQGVRVLEDARAGEVFVGSYLNNQASQPDVCLDWQAIEAMAAGYYCCHAEPVLTLDGWTRVPLSLSRSAAVALEVESVCAAGALQLDSLPIYPELEYLQLSQAERHARA